MGLTEVPEAGDTFYEVKDEKMAKHLIERRKRQAREKSNQPRNKSNTRQLIQPNGRRKIKVLNLIVKADVQGSVEAVKQSMEKLANEEVKVKVIHSAAGAVNQSDVTLAKVSNAIIIAFNVRPDHSKRNGRKRGSRNKTILSNIPSNRRCRNGNERYAWTKIRRKSNR